MLKTQMADLFQVRNRFFRSTHLERDFGDPGALNGYVITPSAKTGFERLAGGLTSHSTQRAWRLTGDFGTGKSSFALALARLFGGNDTKLPSDLRRSIDFRGLGVNRPNLLPVLVTGSRSHIGTAILEALARALEESCPRGRRPQIIEKAKAAALKPETRSAEAAVTLLNEAASYLRENDKASGVLLVLDELGKFLEYAVLSSGTARHLFSSSSR